MQCQDVLQSAGGQLLDALCARGLQIVSSIVEEPADCVWISAFALDCSARCEELWRPSEQQKKSAYFFSLDSLQQWQEVPVKSSKILKTDEQKALEMY